MASDVDICNLALGFLGDEATVVSIDPPEGSAQADKCARFYPTAVAACLELHEWSFSITRTIGNGNVTPPPSAWQYAYAWPADAVRVWAVLPQDSEDINGQEFTVETLSNGSKVILTNQEDAILRYTRLVTDTGRFSPLFVEALICMLAAKLAGPVLRGKTGVSAAKDAMQQLGVWLAKAQSSDAKQGHSRAFSSYEPDWIRNR